MKNVSHLGIGVETDQLGSIVSSVCGGGGGCYRLEPLPVKCTYPVFRGEAEGMPPIFVKVMAKEEWRRNVCAMACVSDTGLVPKVLVRDCLDYCGSAVLVMEWVDAKTVFPEDMTDRQEDSFLDGVIRLSQALQRMPDFMHVDEVPSSPERQYATLADYARRHPLCSRAFADLLDVPLERRTFGARKRAVVHGDFHAKNFGFRGEAFASVCDFGQVCVGLPCGDFVNALVERFSCLSMPEANRRRLKERACRLLAHAPWPRDEMETAVNLRRLDFAARRIVKHPNALWVGLDIERRDRKIREILSCMPDGNGANGRRP